jgi:hypothetical protein
MKDVRQRGNDDQDLKTLVKDYQREMETKAQRVKTIVEDVQRQQAKDRRIILDECKAESAALRALENRVAALTQELQGLKTEIDNSHRLERAAEMLTTLGEGRGPPPRAEPSQGGGGDENIVFGAAPVDTRRQAATGGLVEMREGDFDKMLKGGDAWVVMFYAPWCAHCKAAEPSFQQVGLPVVLRYVCMCVCERERERKCMKCMWVDRCLYECMSIYKNTYIHTYIYI